MSTSPLPDNDRDLDAQIKNLLGNALARTPQPPDMEFKMLQKNNVRQFSRPSRWIFGLGAAAAIAGLLAIANTRSVSKPLAPASSTLPTSPTTTQPTTPTTTQPTPVAAPTALRTIMAGPQGVVVLTPSTDPVSVSELPADLAIEGPDGNIYFSPSVSEGSQNSDSRPYVFDVATGQLTAIDVPNETNQVLELLDVAKVQGQLTLLYVVQSPQCTNGGDPLCLTSLRTFQPATGAANVLAERNAWEFGWNRYTLGNNGIVFGSQQDLVVESPEFFNISTGVTPTREAVGLQENYADCEDCPSSFTIDRAGAHIGWIEGPPNARRLVLTELATGTHLEVAITLSADGAFQTNQGTLRLANIKLENGLLTSGDAVFTTRTFEGPTTPVRIDLVTGEIQNLSPGTVATIS